MSLRCSCRSPQVAEIAARLIQENIPLAERPSPAIALAAEAILLAGTRQFTGSALLFLQLSFFKTEARAGACGGASNSSRHPRLSALPAAP